MSSSTREARPSVKPAGGPGGAPVEDPAREQGATGSTALAAAGLPREQVLFNLLLEPGANRIARARLFAELERTGLRPDDPRLSRMAEALRSLSADTLDVDDFRSVIQSAALIVERALTRSLIVPDFAGFSTELAAIFQRVRENRAGEVASYIPQLGRVEPDRFGLGVCTVDGQRLALGDADTRFSVQSSSKPITYSLALEEHGEERVHRHVGREPSGRSFNELALNPRGLPHNPMVNAGAIMSAALVRPESHIADRFEYVLEMWTRLTGGTQPGFSTPTYLSERSTADRNFALGYSMRERGAFPDGTDLLETLEFYFQLCSIELDVEAFSVVAATLANGGICPITGEAVLKPATVQKTLSLMYSCGMYDYSGEWAFRVGLPAKSGVSGIVLVVIPNVMGLALWAPRLDEHGNSVRGVDFCRQLVREFNFHNYDNLIGGAHGKKDPRLEADRVRRASVVDLCWAAAEGDVDGMRRLVAEGADPAAADYDGRTPLHLAAAEGRLDAVDYLLALGVPSSPKDRWGRSPVDDADRGHHADVADRLAGKV